MSKNTGFYSWLLSQEKRDGPIGDLAADVKSDRAAPDDEAGKGIWLSHLRHSGACREAIDAFNEAWSEFAEKS